MMKRLTILALGLWVVTVAVIGTIFVRGSTAPASDGRTAVILQPAERDFVLGEMRGMLMAIRGISDGLATNRTGDIVQAAREAGGAATHHVPVALMAKLPLEFKQMGMAMHAGFDEFAIAAEHGEANDKLLGRLTGQLNQCVACHQLYLIEPAH